MVCWTLLIARGKLGGFHHLENGHSQDAKTMMRGSSLPFIKYY
uniref:Uncharacterized protein n=1 Tax=Anguilla anguilla TaxID=7936 RepID=A0A0E9XWZ7_ANGAN